MKSILPNFNCMRTAEVQFSEIKLIWSLKYILGRWDGGRWDGATVDGDRWDGGRCFWKTPIGKCKFKLFSEHSWLYIYILYIASYSYIYIRQ